MVIHAAASHVSPRRQKAIGGIVREPRRQGCTLFSRAGHVAAAKCAVAVTDECWTQSVSRRAPRVSSMTSPTEDVAWRAA